jgi:hypothetical protein
MPERVKRIWLNLLVVLSTSLFACPIPHTKIKIGLATQCLTIAPKMLRESFALIL